MSSQPIGFYSLHVNSLLGDNYTSIVNLDMNTKKSIVLVQTDKSIYKPADKVQFRVLVLNSDMKARKKIMGTIYISDGAQNRIKQFDTFDLSKGFFQNELQLSDSPVMGKWKIHVKLNGEDETRKEFEVAEYVLPKFEVTLDANPDANFKDGVIRVSVNAKYTFGKIAKGFATVTAEVVANYWRQQPNMKVLKIVTVDGKKPVEFHIEDELGIKDKDREKTVKLTASFKEELTGREMNTTATVTIHTTPHKIELKKSSDYFKPGMPFTVSAFVKHHDKNAPVSDKTNPLKFTIKYYYDVLRDCKHYREPLFQNLMDSKSTIGETIKAYNCRDELFEEKSSEVFVSNGLSVIDIEFPSNTTKIEVNAKYLETEKTLYYIQRAESKSNQFIQIKPSADKPIDSKKVHIDVLLSENISQFTYQVLAKGDVVVSKIIPVSNEKNFHFEFVPTSSMIPKANLVVFYISNDGEIISDSLKLDFDSQLQNFVSFMQTIH